MVASQDKGRETQREMKQRNGEGKGKEGKKATHTDKSGKKREKKCIYTNMRENIWENNAGYNNTSYSQEL